jgi:hypothetical protein
MADGHALAYLSKGEIKALGASPATTDLVPVWDVSANTWVLCTVAEILAAT